MKWFTNLFKLENTVTVLAIILGFISSSGLIDDIYPPQKVVVAVITLISMQLLVERLGIMENIYNLIKSKTIDENSVSVLSRNDKEFEHLPEFLNNATEVMVIGIDLGFMAKAAAWFIKKSINEGLDLKIIMINPEIDKSMKEYLNLHDERNSKDKTLHDHISTAKDVIEVLKAMPSENCKGKIEIRGRKGIPSPSLTLVNPTNKNGKIRVEIKPYKRNQGDVPFFILTKKNKMYSLFYKHYYEKLWEDSDLIFNSNNQ